MWQQTGERESLNWQWNLHTIKRVWFKELSFAFQQWNILIDVRKAAQRRNVSKICAGSRLRVTILTIPPILSLSSYLPFTIFFLALIILIAFFPLSFSLSLLTNLRIICCITNSASEFLVYFQRNCSKWNKCYNVVVFLSLSVFI